MLFLWASQNQLVARKQSVGPMSETPVLKVRTVISSYYSAYQIKSSFSIFMHNVSDQERLGKTFTKEKDTEKVTLRSTAK